MATRWLSFLGSKPKSLATEEFITANVTPMDVKLLM